MSQQSQRVAVACSFSKRAEPKHSSQYDARLLKLHATFSNFSVQTSNVYSEVHS